MPSSERDPRKRKDPQDRTDFTLKWHEFLEDGDTILTSTWSAQTGIATDGDTHTDTTATVWLTGGRLHKEYRVTNHIVTAGGRELDGSILVKVVSR